MAMSQPSSAGAVVVDSNVLISICSKETSLTTAEFLTFDKRVVNVAANNAPSVKVNLLPS